MDGLRTLATRLVETKCRRIKLWSNPGEIVSSSSSPVALAYVWWRRSNALCQASAVSVQSTVHPVLIPYEVRTGNTFLTERAQRLGTRCYGIGTGLLLRNIPRSGVEVTCQVAQTDAKRSPPNGLLLTYRVL